MIHLCSDNNFCEYQLAWILYFAKFMHVFTEFSAKAFKNLLKAEDSIEFNNILYPTKVNFKLKYE